MLEIACHCGKVRLAAEHAPTTVRQCNCSICRRYGAIWAYYAPGDVRLVSGAETLSAYASVVEGALRFLHCSICGCVTHYETLPGRTSMPKVALNVRSAVDPTPIARLPIEMFDGATSWTVLWARSMPDLFVSPHQVDC